MFSDEIMLLELRLKILDKFINKFIITESKYLHNGESKKLNFDINKFKDFKNKIEYIVVDKQPPNILSTKISDTSQILNQKKIFNSLLRENYQRENLATGLHSANKDDFIIIGDLDEIPKLNNIDFNDLDNEILIFKQKMFYYKFNLCYENFIWFGSKCTKKKNLISPQWLRNIKNKNYPKWRIDTLFSKKKYNNIKFIEDGGWHFTCIKKPKDIHKKLLTFLHHQDYEDSKINYNELEKRIYEKKILYDHKKDKKNQNKWFSEKTLTKIDFDLLPEIIVNSKIKYKDWID
jgi:beta-1,4-mannosyl-glycoprotein beta-1,4-N-acetylglucosaminyltransferase